MIDTLAILDFNRALNSVIIKLSHFDYVDIVFTIFLKYYFVISVLEFFHICETVLLSKNAVFLHYEMSVEILQE